MILSIIWFISVLIVLGLGINFFVLKNNELSIYNIILSLSLGMVIFVMLTMIFNLAHIPLYSHIFTIISFLIIGCIIYKFKNNVKFKFNLCDLLVLILSFILILVMLKGAFVYDWLEDDDPYDHAVAAEYISEHKTAVKSMEQFQAYGRFYMEPYPPAFPIVMGMVHQLNDSVSGTLKIVNAILLGFAVLFFYLFASELFDSKYKALFASFIIACVPSFMSHFIWSQTLAIVLMFPAFYCVLKTFKTIDKEQNLWYKLGILSVTSVLLTQPSTAAIFGLMFGFMWVAFVIATKKLNFKVLFIGIAAVVFAVALFWGPTIYKYGVNDTAEGIGLSQKLFTDANVDTSGGEVYFVKDFIVAPTSSKIDQAIGWGVVVFISLLIGLVIIIKKFKRENYISVLLLLWMLFTFLGTEGNAFPVKLFPHRFWVFMIIPVALIIAYSLFNLSQSKVGSALLVIIICVGILFTSGIPKYIVQTSMWPAGGNFMSIEQVGGYVWMKNNLPKDSNVFVVCGKEEKVVAFDMYSPVLDMNLYRFKQQNNTISDILDFTRDYKYILFDIQCIKQYGINETNNMLNYIVSVPSIKISYQNQQFWLFERV